MAHPRARHPRPCPCPSIRPPWRAWGRAKQWLFVPTRSLLGLLFHPNPSAACLGVGRGMVASPWRWFVVVRSGCSSTLEQTWCRCRQCESGDGLGRGLTSLPVGQPCSGADCRGKTECVGGWRRPHACRGSPTLLLATRSSIAGGSGPASLFTAARHNQPSTIMRHHGERHLCCVQHAHRAGATQVSCDNP